MFELINDSWWSLLQEFVYVLSGFVISLNIIIALNLILFGGTRAERTHAWGARGAFTQKRFDGLEER